MYRRATPPQNSGETVFRKQPIPPPRIDCSPPPEQKIQAPPRTEATKNPLFGNPLSAFLDSDMKIIIAMLLLLSGDGGDVPLLMALMYIML